MTAVTALLRQPHSDWLARIRTVGLGLGGRGVMGLGLGRSSVQAAAGNGLLTGLLTYWALDEASGTRYDSHSNGYDMTEVGTLGSTAGLVYANAALYSESADNFLTRTRATSALVNFSAATPMTIAFWCYPTSFAGGPDVPNYYKQIVVFNYASSFTGGYRVQSTAGGQVYVSCGKTGGPPQYDRHVVNSYLTINAWNHFVWTHNAGAMVWYLNGSQVDSNTNSIAWAAATSGSFDIGAWNNSGGKYEFDGRLGPIAMWSRALSADEIALLYNGGAGLAYAQFTT